MNQVLTPRDNDLFPVLGPVVAARAQRYHLLRDGTTTQSVRSHRRRLCLSDDAGRKSRLPKLSQMIINMLTCLRHE